MKEVLCGALVPEGEFLRLGMEGDLEVNSEHEDVPGDVLVLEELVILTMIELFHILEFVLSFQFFLQHKGPRPHSRLHDIRHLF